MSGELKISFKTGAAVDFYVFNDVGQIWNTNTSAFEAYASANIGVYAVAGAQLGSSPFYTGTFPVAIIPGIYDIAARQRVGGSPAETDPVIGTEDGFNWSGASGTRVPLTALASSGQVANAAPIVMARGMMRKDFGIYLKSSVDHVTPFVSGIVSGQIIRDNGTVFGPLQSGAFTEVGLGWYNLQALTSGDLLANSVKLLFTANGISGGTADPLPISIQLQRVSGVS